MDLLEKWIQDNQLQDPDNIDALLEAADLTRQLVQDRNYEGISKMISYTIDHDYYECFTWILDLLQEEFEKTREFDLEDFSCGIGRSIANYDEFAGRLQVDHNAQDHEVERYMMNMGKRSLSSTSSRTRPDTGIFFSSRLRILILKIMII